MHKSVAAIVAFSFMLAGCSSMFGLGGGGGPRMAYVGDLASNRTARAGDIIAYAKTSGGQNTIAYRFKGVDGEGGIHILRVVRPTNPQRRRAGVRGFFGNEAAKSEELVYMPDQTLLVSPGVHVVFINSAPGELQYRVVMTQG